MTLWLDDVQKQSLTFIDNDTRTLTDVRLGAQGVDANTSGTLYFDDLESRRFSYIGTLTDPGVDDPQASNPAGWTASTYSYSASIPHAVTSVAIENGGTNSYEYDANGNMTCRIEGGVTYSQTYNAENRISSIAKRTGDCTTGTIIESWSFAYDGDGVHVMTAHFTGTSGTPDSTTSYYMGGQFEVKDGATKKYYSIAGMMVAVNDGTGLQYLLTDHLGSTVAVTNQSGTLTSQQRYLPFGEERTDITSPQLPITDFGYTGQRQLDDGMGGIMDYKARFYSPALGRFLQPDTIIPDQSNPQSWNRFGYVYNNPILNNDPTGHCPMCIGLIAGAIVGAATYAITTAVSGRDFNAGDLAVATAVGAAGGFLIGTGVGAASGVAAFAAIGAGTGTLSAQIGYSVSSGKDYDSGEMVIAASVSTVTGAVKGALSAINPGGTSTANTVLDGVSGGLQYGLTQMYNGRPFSKNLAIESMSTGFISAGVSGILDDVLGGPSSYQNYSAWLNMSSKNTFLSSSTVKYLARAAATAESIKGISVSAVSEISNNYVQKKLLRVE